VVTEDATRSVSGPLDGSWSLWNVAPWSAWSDYAPASACVGLQNRTRARRLTRGCSEGTCGGKACVGPETQVELEAATRLLNGTLDGSWLNLSLSEWTAWSGWATGACDGTLFRSRQRTLERSCEPPACGGAPCEGNATLHFQEAENQSTAELCPPGCERAGGWSPWSTAPWSAWSYSLGNTTCSILQVGLLFLLRFLLFARYSEGGCFSPGFLTAVALAGGAES
jgi:hypothetical protein